MMVSSKLLYILQSSYCLSQICTAFNFHHHPSIPSSRAIKITTHQNNIISIHHHRSTPLFLSDSNENDEKPNKYITAAEKARRSEEQRRKLRQTEGFATPGISSVIPGAQNLPLDIAKTEREYMMSLSSSDNDDVIDESDMRRGNKTASAIWGNEASVLVGDFLFARAFELMVETDQIKVLGRLANAAARITEGEIDQMILAGNPAAPVDDYYRVIRAKTAELFAAAGESGAMVAGADTAVTAAVAAYGMALGTAFQITDDALDYAATTEGMGKSHGDDFKEGKITLPVMLAWQDGNADEQAFWQRCLGEGDIGDGDLDSALSLMNKHDTIARSLDIARSHAIKAGQIIADTASGNVADALITAAAFAADRTI